MVEPYARSPATNVSDWSLYGRLLGFLAPYWHFFVISLAGFALYSFGVVLLADLMQFLLDAMAEPASGSVGIISGITYGIFSVPQGERLGFVRIAVPILLVGLTLFRGVGFFAGSYFVSLVARNLVHDLRRALFEKMLSLPGAHYDENNPGTMVSRITYNADQVSGAVTRALKTVLRESLVVIGLVAYMLYLNWKLCLVLLAVAPLITLVVNMVGRHFRRYSRRIQASMGEVTQIATEALGAMHEIRMYAGQRAQRARFLTASDSNREQTLKLAFVESLSTPTLQVLLALALAVLMWFALSPAVIADLSAGSLVAFLVAAVQLGKPLRQLSGIQSELQRGLAAVEDIFSQLDAVAERDNGEYKTGRIAGNISIRHLTFAYPGSEHPALEDVSLEIAAGETVALVGPSGSGKTTLTRLLTRAYDPPAGSILLDAVPIEHYGLECLREQFSQVSQRVPLFRGTVYQNIAFGSLQDKPESKVLQAVTAAGCNELVEALPKGLGTMLTEDGEGLSGGQRQRIALARAMLKDAPVLILDEATSALDASTEYQVRKAVTGATHGRTTIVIAHRLSTVESADRIIVLAAGRVVANGTHADLIAQPGLYQQLRARELAG